MASDYEELLRAFKSVRSSRHFVQVAYLTLCDIQIAAANLGALPTGRTLGRVVPLAPAAARQSVLSAVTSVSGMFPNLVRIPTPTPQHIRMMLQSAAIGAEATLFRARASL